MHTLEAIADPTRRRIVEMLAQRDLSVGEIVDAFSMSAPAISQHLKVLREAGLVNSRVEGQTRIQTLNPMGLQQIHSWLITTMNYWNQRLDALEALLRAEDEAATSAGGNAAGVGAKTTPAPNAPKAKASPPPASLNKAHTQPRKTPKSKTKRRRKP